MSTMTAPDRRQQVIDLGVPGTEVPGFLPGPLDASNGWRGHDLARTFEVPAVSPGWRLRFAFVAGHGPCPDLQIVLDGRHVALVHPTVRRDDRSEVYRHGPIAGNAVVDLEIPGVWLAPGEHEITITTALDTDAVLGAAPEPADRGARAREQFGVHFGSGITPTSLTLEPAAEPSTDLTADLVATPLYLRGSDGLEELIELTVHVPGGVAMPRSAEVTIGALTRHVGLHRPNRTFGDVRVRLAVPELAGETPATVVVDGVPRLSTTLRPARQWTLHLIPHVHQDIGYTDVQGKTLELHSRNIDRALAALELDPAFRFTIDGASIVDEYLATRSDAAGQRLLAALRSGAFSVNALSHLYLTGVTGLEEVARSLATSARLRELGVPITYANLTDIPSYSAALPRLLKDAGIEAFVGVENHHRGGDADSDAQHLASPVMWEGIDGTRMLTHFSDTYSQLRFMIGDPQTVVGAAHSLVRFVNRFDRPDYLPHDLAIFGAHADNEDLADGDAGFAGRWNAVFAYPRIQVSTLADYLDAVRPLAESLPVWRGDGGSYWEDGAGTAAAMSADLRCAQAALPAAEAIAVAISWLDDVYRPNRAALDRAWEGALYGCEHTFTWSAGAAYPHGSQVADQLAWKEHQVATAVRGATDETRRAMSQLGELVASDGPSLLVHNPLSWTRPIVVETEAPAGTPFFLLGPGGESEELGTEVLTACQGWQRYRLTVPDVPGLGYRRLAVGASRVLSPGEEDGSSRATATESDAWEKVPARLTTSRWEVELDEASGAVVGLRHRATGRDILDPTSRWRLADVVRTVDGEDDADDAPFEHSGVPHTHVETRRTTILGRRPFTLEPQLTEHAAPMRPVGVRRTYDGWRIRSVGAAPGLPRIELDVVLHDDTDRVDVTVTLDKEPVLAKESVYVAFPFAAADPVFRYDRQLGWVDPTRDHAVGACQEWFTHQYAVVVEDGHDDGATAVVWTAVDAPLVAFGDVVRCAWPETFDPASGSVLSWVTNNYWPTNTPPEQGGRLRMRYAFAPLPGGFSPLAAARFGREVRAPMIVSDITRLDKFAPTAGPLPGEIGVLLDLGLPEWVDVSVREAAGRIDGSTAVEVRLQDLAGRGGRVTLRHPSGSAGRAEACALDGRPLTPLTVDADGLVTADLDPWGTFTLRLTRAPG